MKAVKVLNVQSNGKVVYTDHPEPKLEGPADVIVKILCIGLDGTDRDILTEHYGIPPQGENDLIIGHESLGVVVEAGNKAGLKKGDLVTALVRRPCHEPSCVNCRNGRSDYCQTLKYTERGIRGENGYLTEMIKDDERYFIQVPWECAPFGMLAEPQSIVEKVWDEVQFVQQRLIWQPRNALVLGSGPLGLLAAMTARSLGLDVQIWSLEPANSTGGQIIEAIGGKYQQAGNEANPQLPRSLREFAENVNLQADLILECTGFSPLAFEAMDVLAPNGVLALLGVTPGNRNIDVASDRLNMQLVLENKCIIGSVNAARKHFETGIYRLQQFERKFPGMLQKLITQRFTLEQVPTIDFKKIDVKAVVDVVPQEQWTNWANEQHGPEVAYSFSV